MNKKFALTLTALFLTATPTFCYKPGFTAGIFAGYLTKTIVDNCDPETTINALRKDKDKLCKFLATKINDYCQDDQCQELIKLLKKAQSTESQINEELENIKNRIYEKRQEIIKDAIEVAQKTLDSKDDKKD